MVELRTPLKGPYVRLTAVVKGNTRSLDYSSHESSTCTVARGHGLGFRG